MDGFGASRVETVLNSGLRLLREAAVMERATIREILSAAFDHAPQPRYRLYIYLLC